MSLRIELVRQPARGLRSFEQTLKIGPWTSIAFYLARPMLAIGFRARRVLQGNASAGAEASGNGAPWLPSP
jgi:hypothetical protein